MADLIGLSSKLAEEDFRQIPIIDLTDARSPDLDRRRRLASEIRSACLTAGFFFVKNHSVPEEIIQQAYNAAESFFSQSKDIKATEVDISKTKNFRGYVRLLTENNDPWVVAPAKLKKRTKEGDMHEAWNIGLDQSFEHFGKGHDRGYPENIWPDPAIWTGAEDFPYSPSEQSLFPLFALALGLEESFFNDKTTRPAAVMRLLRYPAVPLDQVKEENPGTGAHTDVECFTILAQGGPGLQVKNREGKWIDAPVIPGTFVINIGDQFARWTNDVFISNQHRVLPPREVRYSIPFFFGCDLNVPLIPPPTCVSVGRPNKYEIMTAGEYVQQRLSKIYAAAAA